ncbi:MAG: hypothetical protein AAF511_09220 [Pseudomonadota bacterium]
MKCIEGPHVPNPLPNIRAKIRRIVFGDEEFGALGLGGVIRLFVFSIVIVFLFLASIALSAALNFIPLFIILIFPLSLAVDEVLTTFVDSADPERILERHAKRLRNEQLGGNHERDRNL